MATINIEATKNQARELLNTRIKSVEELVHARQRVSDLKEQLAAAERDDKRAYVKATRDGWSPEELKKLGLEPAAAGRRRKAQTKTADAAVPSAPSSAQDNN
ncbi:hypothetical protein [Arthrobacter sp. Soil761]|uniref:hypothetical protein n=1 Tax=Arthrobacter sp. Soil761 TaxID=1736400 RepID=UPI0006F87C47|nr:hypothetical protein [Arthrobacter sp. Soil761]KRE76628.1 hypothetical protein ASG79_17510 [Arthrobacter sp. Soil761]